MDRTVSEQYVIKSKRGFWSNHHETTEGLIGERVTKENATHLIRVITEILEVENG